MSKSESKSSGDEHLCEECGEDFEELVSRQGFIQSFFVHWVCKKCFVKLENIEFDDYCEADYYGFNNKEVRSL